MNPIYIIIPAVLFFAIILTVVGHEVYVYKTHENDSHTEWMIKNYHCNYMKSTIDDIRDSQKDYWIKDEPNKNLLKAYETKCIGENKNEP